ncbi:TPA: Cro/CI family transcriptional regulator [Escherichia coli]
MKKSEVLGYFGGVVKTAAALGTSKTTVSMWGEEVPWKWALLIQAVTAGALKYELHIPTVVIPGSDQNPPSNQGGIHENQA